MLKIDLIIRGLKFKNLEDSLLTQSQPLWYRKKETTKRRILLTHESKLPTMKKREIATEASL